jgi:cobalamin biosynthesis Co2+ chelatase CbiK
MTLKIVVDNVPKKEVKKYLTHKQLCHKLEETGGTHLDREQVVLQNLKDMGF